MPELTVAPPSLSIGPVVTSTVDFGPARARMSKLLQRLLQRIGVTGVRYAKQAMLHDTGFARAHVNYAIDLDGMGVKWGILAMAKHEEGGPNLATILNWQEHGIRRHRVSFTNRDGSIRWMLVKWAERHGFKVWKSMTTGRAVRRKAAGSTGGNSMLAMRSMMVWGYAHPWLSTSTYYVKADFPTLLGSVEGTL
jgi:hypothetical protein